MDYGVCNLTVIPIRLTPSHKSEMVSQLLFAETFQVLDALDDWLYIRCSHDEYLGWIDRKQVILLDELNYKNIKDNSTFRAGESVEQCKCVYRQLPVLLGSPLPYFHNRQFSFFGDTFTYHGEVSDLRGIDANEEYVKQIALKFLDTPYLWGGRSSFGVDCSGFCQLVFGLMNIPLKRDSTDQANQGENVYFIHEAKAGDLAFFDNEEQEIVHVGLLLNNHQIIHAHGKVRMDSIDQQGIFDNERRRYTHSLRLIKRFF